jgi:SDR family mycofactocin-dependent oxidoreductase
VSLDAREERPAYGRLAGKVALVTGAARGIGRAVAHAFAREGADVLGLDIAGRASVTTRFEPATPDDLAETGRLVREHGRRWISVTADQRDIAALRAAAARAVTELGRIDILFACAGIQAFKPLLEMEDADWGDQIDVNLTGTANALRAVAPHLARQGSGRIILVSSTQGRHGMKNGAAYSASKWGIIGLMKSAALELGAHGITVNAVIPGLIDTKLTRNDARYRQQLQTVMPQPPEPPPEDQVVRSLVQKTPLGVPWVEPEDVAPVAVFLASDESRMVSGATFDVTGGDSAHNT